MYKKGLKGWLKHVDFILLDMICLQVAFFLAYIFRLDSGNPYEVDIYRNMALFIEITDIIVIFLFDTFKNVLKRGYYLEFAETVKHVVLVGLLSALFLFAVKQGASYSRIVFFVMLANYAVLAYVIRILWKLHIRKNMSKTGNRSLLIISDKNTIQSAVQSVKNYNFEMFTISGVAVIDADMTGEQIDGIPVVSNLECMTEYVCKSWVDEVLIVSSGEATPLTELAEQLLESGVTVHQSLMQLGDDTVSKRQIVERLGGYTVLTTSINTISYKEAFYKRLLDIVGGFIGCIFTGILFLFVAPAIYISSPGPIFFAQERVGRNGRRFKVYKFRSMYLDAEERKKELMERNRVSDGLMFKMEFDPRIIGNKELPNGKRKTGIGQFIRNTSIDEFPQFFNVLRGDMSLVGTRPPTVDEWEKYQLHHRARLAIKPGITGLWQVSGRSSITDFEEVVKLDTQYIGNWSIGMDLKILFKTVKVVIKGEGSM